LQGALHSDDGRNPGQADRPSATGPVRRRCRFRAGARLMTIDEIMRTAPVIPVLVLDDAHHARELAETLVAGGLRVIEVTLRTGAALDAIRRMNLVPGAIVGAGTVINEAQFEEAYAAG